MPYITIPQSPSFKQLSFEDILFGNVDVDNLFIASNKTNTRTRFVKWVPEKIMNQVNFTQWVHLIKKWIDKYEHLYDPKAEYDKVMHEYRAAFAERKEYFATHPRVEVDPIRDQLNSNVSNAQKALNTKDIYSVFFIPKHSGGLREIDAPCDELMKALRELKELLAFESHPELLGFKDAKLPMHHTTAFAYVNGRCALDAVKRHQANKSNWFLKTDFSNFFGNTTPQFLHHMCELVFPFSVLMGNYEWKQVLTKALDLCFLDGGLPQGTPISPFLTNLMMIPFDHVVSNNLHQFTNGHSYVYTRYADDVLISGRDNFGVNIMVDFMTDVLKRFDAPFELKPSKTRYGSRAGRNWNLGVMLNKDNKITIGYRKKQSFRAMIDSYLKDREHGVRWELHDLQVLDGLRNYYKSVEPDFIKERIQNGYGEKFGVDIEKAIHADIRNAGGAVTLC